MRRCNIPQSLGKPGEDESTEAHSWDCCRVTEIQAQLAQLFLS